MNSLLTGAETASEGTMATPGAPMPEPSSQGKLVLRKFVRHKAAMISSAVLLLLVLITVITPLFWPYDYEQTVGGFLPPTGEHPLGTTQVGKDMVSQVLRGTQYSLLIALTVSVVSTTLGVLIGASAGYLRGFTDSAASRLTDLFLIVPQIAAAAILVKVAGGGSWYVVAMVLAAFGWMPIARIVRAEAMSLSQREFVEASRAAGAGTGRIIFKHLVPNMVGSITVNATLAVAQAVLAEAALSFIGLGVQLPDTSLGRVILENYAQLQGRPWLFFGPFVVLVLISLTINFIGDGLRDAFDPRQRRMKA
ncbi:ABC transporter permease [Amycolatopsis magusensis]|uniref:Peptide/nickel transport system permease protein n=1 Tax=Amycolatopsis magusensis TaxID=882444 RepID=A0ABS4PH65_9PSEU|nr:ABC transporter permease [Amycolatopsis magusensis]MBP2178708.1 peptide/nickel transport system permease protein [Amycolatopsis magusensis]MDI5974771.1 ABC transporter permease [Amycolatopsis magusensis]